MKVLKKSYNVLEIDFGTLNQTGGTIVGTHADYDRISRIARKSGLLKVQMLATEGAIASTGLVTFSTTGNNMTVYGWARVGSNAKILTVTLLRHSDGLRLTYNLVNPG